MKRLTRRLKKELLTRTLSVMPKPARDRYLRTHVNLDYAPSPDLKFKLAQTKDELEQAFRLLHEAYVASGSMKPHPSGMRITPYHALPGTSVLIAKSGDQVIATLSVFRMSPFGIPVSKPFDVSHLLKAGIRFAELSSLTVADAYKKDQRELLFGLLKYVYEYTTRYFGIDMKLIVIKPFRRFFYESLLHFESLDDRVVKNYAFSNGATVVAKYLDLRKAPALYKASYSHYPDRQNLFKYFVETNLDNFEFPERDFNTISDPAMTPELLSYFFWEKTSIVPEMTEIERRVLSNLYPKSSYQLVLGRNKPNPRLSAERIEERGDVKCPAKIISHNNFPLEVRDVSHHGFMGFTSTTLSCKDRLSIAVEVGPGKISQLQAIVRWTSGLGHYGFEIVEADAEWTSLVAAATCSLLVSK